MNIRMSDIYAGESMPLRRGAKFGEPSHGWAAAHVEMNYGTSLKTYLDSLGYDGRDIRPPHVLEWVRSLNIQDFALVENATPRFEGNGVTLMGVTVKRRHWSIGRRRFCPACLGEDPYHRTWWDLTVFERCPIHGMDVVSTDSEGNIVPWWWPSFETSQQGLPIRQMGVSRNDHLPPTIETWLLGRMGVVDRFDAPLLDGVGAVGDALTFVERLGALASLSKDEANAKRMAFDALSAGEEAVFRCIDETAEQISASRPDKSGVEGLFGNVYNSIRYYSQAPFVDLLSDMMKAVAKKHGFTGARTNYDGMIDGVGVQVVGELANEFDFDPGTMRRFLRKYFGKGTNPDQQGKILNLSPNQVESARSHLSQLVDADGMCEALGIERNLFDGLVRLGKLTSYIGRDKIRLYSLDDAARLNCSVEEAPLISLQDRFVRIRDLTTVRHDAVETALKAGLDPARWNFYRCGDKLGDLLIERVPTGMVARIKVKRSRARSAEPGLPLARAAALISVKYDIIRELVRDGSLPTIEGTMRIDEDVARRFAAEWAPALIYRPILGMILSREVLLRSRVRHIVVEYHGKRSILVNRADCRRVFRLDCDPDTRPPGSSEAFIAALTENIRNTTSFVTNSSQTTKSELKGRCFRSTTGKISLIVRFSSDKSELMVERHWDIRTERSRHNMGEVLLNWNKISDVYTGLLKKSQTARGLVVWDSVSADNLASKDRWDEIFERVTRVMREFQSLLSTS